jgi:hypothetical protein
MNVALPITFRATGKRKAARIPTRPRPENVPDFQTQLEEILSHVRRCEKWARIDDRIDLSWKLGDHA